MDDKKKDRLIARGWKVGDAADFLGMSPAETAYTELRLNLATSLKARRLATKLTQAQLAKRLNSSQSRVAKMEACDPTVSVDLLIRAHLAAGATRTDLGSLIGADIAA
jgi:hypothetical protein